MLSSTFLTHRSSKEIFYTNNAVQSNRKGLLLPVLTETLELILERSSHLTKRTVLPQQLFFVLLWVRCAFAAVIVENAEMMSFNYSARTDILDGTVALPVVNVSPSQQHFEHILHLKECNTLCDFGK